MEDEEPKKKRLPDYELSALNKSNEYKGKVGAAWINEPDGSISIRLNPFVVLSGSPDLVLTLFKRDEYRRKES